MKDKIENIEELQKAMWELRLCAEEITQSAKAGEFLTEQLFAKTSEKLRTLQELQEECKEVFFQDGFVVGSINDMRTALEEYEKKKSREALADVKKVFMDFMRICSDQEKPEQALEKIRGKRVALIDDVIATGESIEAIESLAKAAGANVVARAAILAELQSVHRKDIIYLKEHYVFRPNPDGTYTPLDRLD